MPNDPSQYGDRSRSQPHPDVERTLESIRSQAQENAELARLCEGQRARISELEMQLRLTREMLLRAERDRDYYQTQANYLVQGLTDVNSVIVELVRAANERAAAPPPSRTAGTAPVDEDFLEAALQTTSTPKEPTT